MTWTTECKVVEQFGESKRSYWLVPTTKGEVGEIGRV